MPDIAGVAKDTIPRTTRYAAFISYSHADDEVAEWLHRHLESYDVPKSIRGRRTGTGAEIDRRLGKIFRDRAEFGARHDLASEIRSALDRSDALIVLCSPASATSAYVAEEIRYFKSLGRGTHILAAIVSGEPHASRKSGARAADECFPHALLHVLDENEHISDVAEEAEPIAADFRDGKDGRENGALKLVAGLLDIGLDDLVQRQKAAELQRRRQAYLIASGMAVLALGAVIGGVLAFVNGDLASRRSAELEVAYSDLSASKREVEITNGELEASNKTLDLQLKQITRLSTQMSSVVGEITQIVDQTNPVPEKLLFLSYGAGLGISAASLDLLFGLEFVNDRTFSPQSRSTSVVCLGAGYCSDDFPADQMRQHWGTYLPAATLDLLAANWSSGAAGVRRIAGLNISRKAAINVFGKYQLPEYTNRIKALWPNSDALHPDSFGALLSVYINIGSKRFTEIAATVAGGDPSTVPDAIVESTQQLKSNPRLAPVLAGLDRRRRMEAELFQKGLDQQLPVEIPAGQK